MMLANILKQRRTELGLTQSNVASQLHVRRQTVSNWETGKSYPDIPTLVAISKLYKLSLDYMLKGDERYMNQVKKDYQLINQKKDGKWLNRAMLILLGLTLLPVLFTPFATTAQESKFIGIWVMTFVLLLMPVSYLKLKSLYQGDVTDLFVPKSTGLGITINPNHPLGFLLWLVLELVLLGFYVLTILTPA
jgi:transcriptional regulator with XRE-family HTH domain